MSDIINRIREVIRYKGISERKFSSEIGVSAGFLSNVSDVGSSKVAKIISVYPEINPGWLLTGEGRMIQESSLQEQNHRDSAVSGDDFDTFTKGLAWLVCSSYAKKNDSDFTLNSFNELAEIFKSVSAYLCILQQAMESDIAQKVLSTIKNNPQINEEGYFVIDDSVQNVLNKYMSIHDKLKDVSLDAMLILRDNNVLSEVLETFKNLSGKPRK